MADQSSAATPTRKRRRIQPFEVLTIGAAIVALWVMLGPSDWSAGLLSGPGPDTSTIAKGERRAQLLASHERVSFNLLSGFSYGDLPPMPGLGASMNTPPRSREQAFPPDVLALDGKAVAINGFMLPLDADEAGVGHFLLNANRDLCYFGAPTRVNDFIVVKMRGDKRTVLTHLPIVVFGQISVGEERRGNRLSSIYRLDAEAIAAGTAYPM